MYGDVFFSWMWNYVFFKRSYPNKRCVSWPPEWSWTEFLGLRGLTGPNLCSRRTKLVLVSKQGNRSEACRRSIQNSNTVRLHAVDIISILMARFWNRLYCTNLTIKSIRQWFKFPFVIRLSLSRLLAESWFFTQLFLKSESTTPTARSFRARPWQLTRHTWVFFNFDRVRIRTVNVYDSGRPKHWNWRTLNIVWLPVSWWKSSNELSSQFLYT